MKTPRAARVFAVLVALAFGFAWWLARPARPAPAGGPQAPRPAAGAATAPAAVTPVATASAYDLAAERLLRDVAAMAAEFERLRALPADDIENLRRGADLENEFAALLDVETAAFLVREMPPGFTDTRFGVIALHKWANAERGAAAEWMAALPGATASCAEGLARGWQLADAAGLRAHLETLPAGAWRTHLAVIAAEDAFVAKDPQVALALLERAEWTDARRAQLAEWTVTAWAIGDAEAAAAWAGREPDAARRERLAAAVAVGQANRDPRAAATRLLQSVTEPDVFLPALNAIVRLWAMRDPASAAQWVKTFPAGPTREEAEQNLREITNP